MACNEQLQISNIRWPRIYLRWPIRKVQFWTTFFENFCQNYEKYGSFNVGLQAIDAGLSMGDTIEKKTLAFNLHDLGFQLPGSKRAIHFIVYFNNRHFRFPLVNPSNRILN